MRRLLRTTQSSSSHPPSPISSHLMASTAGRLTPRRATKATKVKSIILSTVNVTDPCSAPHRVHWIQSQLSADLGAVLALVTFVLIRSTLTELFCEGEGFLLAGLLELAHNNSSLKNSHSLVFTFFVPYSWLSCLTSRSTLTLHYSLQTVHTLHTSCTPVLIWFISNAGEELSEFERINDTKQMDFKEKANSANHIQLFQKSSDEPFKREPITRLNLYTKVKSGFSQLGHNS
jgi:hypothetical protein